MAMTLPPLVELINSITTKYKYEIDLNDYPRSTQYLHYAADKNLHYATDKNLHYVADKNRYLV